MLHAISILLSICAFPFLATWRDVAREYIARRPPGQARGPRAVDSRRRCSRMRDRVRRHEGKALRH